jgi:hypothetical protein
MSTLVPITTFGSRTTDGKTVIAIPRDKVTNPKRKCHGPAAPKAMRKIKITRQAPDRGEEKPGARR